MMGTSMDALAGMRLLLAGSDPGERDAHRAELARAGAHARTVGSDPDEVAGAVAADPPSAILVLDGDPATVRRRLDPLGLGGGPLVLTVEDVAGPGEPLSGAPLRRLRAHMDRQSLRERLRELEAVVAGLALARRRELELDQVDTLRRLAQAAEYRDDNTEEHTQRVGHLAAQLGRHLGLDDRAVWLLRQAAPLHDLGKIAVPDSILLKPGRLSEEEFQVIKTHAVLGARVLANADSDLLQAAERVARAHHERWDGTGYPDGLAGDEIPLEGRLVHVADVFDVLVHERPYKDSWTVAEAAEEIRRGAGTQFDPSAVQAFEDLGPKAWRVAPSAA
jgi:HD domain-containing protein